jgi:phage terminase small subunit
MTDPRPRAGDGKLRPRDEQFCKEYIIDFNGQNAAIRAGFPPKSARIKACQALARPEIQARVTELIAERGERTGITADWVVNSIAAVARRCTAADTFDASGANRALELLGRHLGIFEKDNAQRAASTVEDIIRALDERDQRFTGDVSPDAGIATYRH